MKYLALDFETGGLDHQRHAVTQLGLALMEDGEVLDSIDWWIAPVLNKSGAITLEYNAVALRIQGKTLDWIEENGKPESHVHAEALGWLKSRGAQLLHTVSHNTAFDAAFYSQFMFRQGRWDRGQFVKALPLLGGAWSCTMRAAQVLLPNLKDHKLDTVATHFGLARTSELHDAKEDAILCGRILHELKKANSK